MILYVAAIVRTASKMEILACYRLMEETGRHLILRWAPSQAYGETRLAVDNKALVRYTIVPKQNSKVGVVAQKT